MREDDAIKGALREAAKAFCICDGECYETRHGMMNGSCEQMVGQAAAAVAAFLRALPEMGAWDGEAGRAAVAQKSVLDKIAAAVTRAASEDKT